MPIILAINPMQSITFSQWAALSRCRLKASLHLATIDGRLPEPPTTRSSLVGMFHHKAMEFAVKISSQSDLRKALETEILKLQSIVSESPHLRRLGSVSGWDEINRSVILADERASARGGVTGGPASAAETGLRSTSGILQGRPDFFSVGPSGGRLREYKSGRIRDEEGNLLAEYREQVRFYSCLIFDNFAVDSISALIESLSGDRFEFTISRAEARQFEIEVEMALAEFNRSLHGLENPAALAKPSNPGCTYCVGRIACPSFKKVQDELDLVGEQYVLEGSFNGLESRMAQRVAIVLDVWRDKPAELIIPQAIADQLSKKASYLFLNVVRRGAGWLWGQSSRVFISA